MVAGASAEVKAIELGKEECNEVRERKQQLELIKKFKRAWRDRTPPANRFYQTTDDKEKERK